MRIAEHACPARTGLRIGVLGALGLVSTLIGQDLPAPPASPSETAIETPTPTATSTETATPTATPTPYPVRSVRISFVPPPLDGTISLGIYDAAGKLVRVLHQQAALDDFTIGADALQTKWDGKDDAGQDLPSGKYHARGFVVGRIQLENLGTPTPDVTPPSLTSEKLPVKLMPNPLGKNDRPTAELTISFAGTGSFLKNSEELPLFVISERTGITKILMSKNGEKSIDLWQESSSGTERFRLSKLDQMMAFDCGAFDLK